MENLVHSFTASPVVTQLQFDQTPDRTQSELALTIQEGDALTHLRMRNPTPAEAIFDIVDASRIWIEDEGSTQKEFGRYKVGYSDEAYSEFWVDSVENEPD